MRLFRNLSKPLFSQARTMTTIATLKRLSAKSLSEKIIEEVNATDPTFAVIDVRDNGKLTFSKRTRNLGFILSLRFFKWSF
jgi:hypothetical protein